MKTKSLLVLSILLALCFTLQSQEWSYLPTADDRDAKMILLLGGVGMTNNIGPADMEFQMQIPQTYENLEFGIFDGNIGGRFEPTSPSALGVTRYTL